MGKNFSKQRHKPRFTKAQIPWLIRGVIRSNNLETMQYLLSYPNDVNPSMVIDGVCPMNLAVELGHLQMVKLLLKAGADIHIADSPRYPLHQACLYGRPDIADLLIRSGAKVSMLTERHQSCLHLLAGQSGQRYLETARHLLEHGCDPNTLDDDGFAPLHKASVEMISILAACEKTDMNILSLTGDTPLLTAAKDRREAVVLALVRVEMEHKQPVPPPVPNLFMETDNLTPSAKYAGSGTSSRLTLVSANGVGGGTPSRGSGGWAQRVFRTSSAATIHLRSTTTATFSGRSSSSHHNTTNNCIKPQPASQGVSFRSTFNFAAFTDNKQQPHNASFHSFGHHKCNKTEFSLEALLRPRSVSPTTPTSVEPRLNLDQCDNIGMTPLMICAEAGQAGFRMVVSLVSAGCDIGAVDKMGMTALHYACYVGAIIIVRFLIEEAGEFSEKRPLDLLNLQDRFGRTPIYLATCRGHTEVVAYLISCNADLHSPNNELKSPLYIAANFGHLDIVNDLLRHSAQVNQADSHDKTPLYVATYHGRADIVSLLLEAGANVNAADKNGKTPLYTAVLHGHLALAARLLSAGAAVNRPDNEGLGPLHMAVKFPKLDIPMIKLLLSHGCDPVNLAGFTRWLVGHGILTEDRIDGELAGWLRQEERNVCSLKRLCRAEIQAALGGGDIDATKIAKLPLPAHLRSFVSMRAL